MDARVSKTARILKDIIERRATGPLSAETHIILEWACQQIAEAGIEHKDAQKSKETEEKSEERLILCLT